MELSRRQIDGLLAKSNQVRAAIQQDILEYQDVRQVVAVTSEHSPCPRHQLAERKRFGQIIVGPEIQSGHAVIDLVFRGQHDDRHITTAPELTCDLQTIEARQHDIQNNDIGLPLESHLHSFRSGGRLKYFKTLVGKTHLEKISNLWLVIDNQYTGLLVSAGNALFIDWLHSFSALITLTFCWLSKDSSAFSRNSEKNVKIL